MLLFSRDITQEIAGTLLFIKHDIPNPELLRFIHETGHFFSGL